MKKLITEDDITDLAKSGSNVLVVSSETVITPLALDKIKNNRINVIYKDATESDSSVVEKIRNVKQNRISVGSDHTGFKIKNIVIKFLSEKGYEVVDVGTFDENSCDYPDIAKAVVYNIMRNKSDFGILIDATGVPSAITANKFPGIRAATCYNEFSARSSREHNNANILSVGAKSLGEESIKSIILAWLNSDFLSGRHQRRLDKISEIEKEIKNNDE